MSDALRISLGYIISFVYMAVVMLAGDVLCKKFGVDKELSRKISHLLSSACWIICAYFTGPTYHTVIINAVALVLVSATVLAGKLKFAETNGYGLIYFCLVTLVVMSYTVFIDPKLFAATGIAYYSLAIGDGLAPIFGRAAKKRNVKVFGNKTLVGSITVFVSSALVALAFNFIYGLGLGPLFIVSVGALATVMELIGVRGTDNLLIDFAVFAYAAAYIYGGVSTPLAVAVTLATPLFILDSALRVLTPAANVISYFYLLVSVHFLGYVFLVPALILFGLEAVISRVTSKIYERAAVDKERHERGAFQILANCGIVLVLTVVYGIVPQRALMFAAFAVFIEEVADSVASDIGRLSPAAPLDILRLKRMQACISGGVSAIGTFSAAATAFAGAALPFIFLAFDYVPFLIVACVAFAGTIADSVFGSSVQALFKCTVCGNHTELENHCGAPATLVKGSRAVTNTVVNLLSAIVTGGLAVGLLFWLL